MWPGPGWDIRDEHIYKTPLTWLSIADSMDLLSQDALQCPSTMLLTMEYLKCVVDKTYFWDNVPGQGKLLLSLLPDSSQPCFPLDSPGE